MVLGDPYEKVFGPTDGFVVHRMGVTALSDDAFTTQNSEDPYYHSSLLLLRIIYSSWNLFIANVSLVCL